MWIESTYLSTKLLSYGFTIICCVKQCCSCCVQLRVSLPYCCLCSLVFCVCVSLLFVCCCCLTHRSLMMHIHTHTHTHIESLFSDCRERPAAIVINTPTISRQTERVKSQTSFDVGRCIVFNSGG